MRRKRKNGLKWDVKKWFEMRRNKRWFGIRR